ncbi:MAG TPA: nitrate- and nitrite sensing domain-containing protein [Pseudonocardia sp.]
MTSTETRGSWSNRLSPRNWSLAWKLVAVGLIPALLAVVLGVLRVADQAQAASELGTANRLLDVRGQVADTAVALRAERDRATLFLAERRVGDAGPLRDATARTDAAVEKIRTAVGDVDLTAPTRAARERAEGGLAQLPVLRAGVTGAALLLPNQVLQRYTTIIDRIDGFDRALLRQMRTPSVAGLTDALTAVTAAQEALAVQHTVLGVSLRNRVVSPDDKATVGVTDGAYVSAFGDYQLALPDTVAPTNFVTSESNAQRDGAKSAIVLAPTLDPSPVSPAAWDDAVARAGADVDKAGTDVIGALTAAGKAAEARSSNLAGVNSVLLMLGLLLAATIIVLVARSLTRSLRVLRSSALDVAQRRLPQAVESMRAGNVPDVNVEPVPLGNRDEVGQVARAFDAVHGQALRLAADQAALQNNVSSMFVNLSRRSQGLVERQLQLIENLESNEQDPDQLSNLFQLDHLATRMRRNSENLLVLAGTDFAKRNVAPVPLVDVLRAAVSEIEHYQRILVQAPPPATIVGRATSDVVHLLAELLDNATNFSPPDSQVVMSSMRTADGSILVEIADRGVGMLDQELADANRRLGTPTTVDVSASRRMGLFVVGRLAARHGITVHLGGERLGGGDGGLTASVTLPAHLVVSAGGDDVRPQREPVGAQNLVNGVPPQRPALGGGPVPAAPGQGGRPPLRPSPAVALGGGPTNGQGVQLPAGRNGLPTRTPGSALRRNPLGGSSAAPVEPPATERPGTGSTRRDVSDLRPDGQPGFGPAPRDRGRDGADRDGFAPESLTHGGTAPEGADRDAFDRDAFDRDAFGQDAFAHNAFGQDAFDRDGFAQDGFARDGSAHDGADRAGSDDVARPAAEDEQAGRDEHDDVAEQDAPVRDADDEHAPAPRADEPPTTGFTPDGRAQGDGAGTADDEVEEARGAGPGDTGGPVPGGDGAEASDGDARADDSGPLRLPGRNVPPRPRPFPAPGPNGTQHDVRVPATPYATGPNGLVANGAGPNGAGSNGAGANGVAANGAGPGSAGDGDGAAAGVPDVHSPPTTPLPTVPAGPAVGPDDPAEVLFSASVPAIAEPEGLPRSRRPLGEIRRGGPADVTETTPIFEEIASAWFASQRPVPVDGEQGSGRPAPGPGRAPAPPSAPRPLSGARREPLPAPVRTAAPAVEESAFASVADEGWRAASGAAAERPDELTAAGLPKRRPRARLVPGSAGSAVLAAPATSSTRSAENIRGRLASYQQGVRQGREVRLHRDPTGTGPQPVSGRDDPTAPAEGEHDENIR